MPLIPSVHCIKLSILINQLAKIFLLILMFGLSPAIFAKTAEIQGIRFWQSPDKTRVVFDMSASSTHELFVLKNPHRVVIDIKGGELSVDLKKLNINSSLVQQIRTSRTSKKSKNGSILRIVLDLKRAVEPKSFTLNPIQNVGHRLVIDLKDPQNNASNKSVITRAKDLKKDNIFVVIDAGHGGEDPGASGKKGSREKAITLNIAKKLAKAINQQKGMRAELSRKGDYYLSLRKRSEMARSKGADLFISIHADAFKSRKVRGSSVWVLSDKGAKSEVGLWLEQRENNADLLGGVESVPLNNYGADVAEVLLKIQTERSVRLSHGIANNVIGELNKIMVMHNKKPRKASFIVLMNPAVPSILIETGFISNAADEKNLRSPKFQTKLANSILRGIHRYFRANTPSGVQMARFDNRYQPVQKKYASKKKIHKIVSGDTLSDIANQYGVSLKTLRRMNRLKGDKLLVGKRLLIPSQS